MTRVSFGVTACVPGKRVVRVKRQSDLRLSLHNVKFLFPKRHCGENPMCERHRWTFLDSDSREMLCDIQSVLRAGETIMEVLIMRKTEPGVCLRIVRIEFYRARHEPDELIEYFACPPAAQY